MRAREADTAEIRQKGGGFSFARARGHQDRGQPLKQIRHPPVLRPDQREELERRRETLIYTADFQGVGGSAVSLLIMAIFRGRLPLQKGRNGMIMYRNTGHKKIPRIDFCIDFSEQGHIFREITRKKNSPIPLWNQGISSGADDRI